MGWKNIKEGYTSEHIEKMLDDGTADYDGPHIYTTHPTGEHIELVTNAIEPDDLELLKDIQTELVRLGVATRYDNHGLVNDGLDAMKCENGIVTITDTESGRCEGWRLLEQLRALTPGEDSRETWEACWHALHQVNGDIP